ncbi:hypothetical protein [Nocardia farcinica]|uniref:hypothetical protein n=1 Tax=Nocardia farcinica TaxID=37329 RepID=UPI001E4E45BB|nr:hypothetical protein [Nocardia farcinica]
MSKSAVIGLTAQRKVVRVSLRGLTGPFVGGGCRHAVAVRSNCFLHPTAGVGESQRLLNGLRLLLFATPPGLHHVGLHGP